MFKPLIFALCLVLSTCRAVPAGTFFLAGGEVADDNADIYGGMVTASGGHNSAVAVITAASADGCCDPDSSWALYEPIFKSYGPSKVMWIPIDENHTQFNKDPAVLRNLSDATLFFFSGGDQVRSSSFLLTCCNFVYTNCCCEWLRSPGIKSNTQARVIRSFFEFSSGKRAGDSPALATIRNKFNTVSGTVISGSSAGTACQSKDVMFMDGTSYSALVNGSFPYNSTGTFDV